MEPKGFMGYPKKGNACELNSYGHEQYPSDSPLSNYGHMQYSSNNLDQNDSVHGVYRIPS
jgi:hypothetical protein